LPIDSPATMSFLAHTRMQDNEIINDQLSYVDWSQYPVLLLGGDLGENTSNDSETMDTYDSYFNFSHPNCLWAIGNHDAIDSTLIYQYTEKPRNPYLFKDDVGIFALNEFNEDDFISEAIIAQIKTATETLVPGNTFILLTHKLIWLAGHPELGLMTNSIANGPEGDCSYCTKVGNFYEVLYPYLAQLESDGIEVICLAGDLGFKKYRFEFLTESGVQFLANGFNFSDEENEFIEFFKEDKKLDWRYVNIDSRK